MHQFRYVGGVLHCEAVPVPRLVKAFGTPLYVYSELTIADHYTRLEGVLSGLDHWVCYALKANSNLAVLRVLAGLGAGFDVVSAGELERVVAAGGNPARSVFAGVGKTTEEIALALRRGVYCFNVESEPELVRIDQVARRMGRKAPVAVRVNPNVDAHTHAKITTGTYENKFGIAFERVEALYAKAARLKHVQLRGIQMHIGSQLTEVGPFEAAVRRVVPLARQLAERHGIEFFSLGGGMGIVYEPALASGQAAWWRTPAARGVLTPAVYASTLLPLLKPLGLRILLEPGRFLVGNAGALLARVEYVKRTGTKRFVVVDAAMNDMIRPAFYEAYHEIVPVRRRRASVVTSDVVGPICESGDFFCKNRRLPEFAEGDYLALLSAGAYGSVMGSNYNSRPLAAEVLVCGSHYSLVRARQPIEEIWRGERLADWQAEAPIQ